MPLAKVDKYGRKQKDTTKEDMRKFYQLEGEEEAINGGLGLHTEESSSEEEEELSDEEKQRQLIFARSRGEIPLGSDSEAESDHGDSTEEEYDELEEGVMLDEKEDVSQLGFSPDVSDPSRRQDQAVCSPQHGLGQH